ncbi:MAG: hypothetical protein PHR16_15335 [Methylovulum sp.]|nr:hypothetical protein [Methylovulum sp.]
MAALTRKSMALLMIFDATVIVVSSNLATAAKLGAMQGNFAMVW